MKYIQASIALILNQDKSKVYLTLRQNHQSFANMWEFPGGKVEKGESFEQTLVRELKEELAIDITKHTFLFSKISKQEGCETSLQFFVINEYTNTLVNAEKQKGAFFDILSLDKIYFKDKIIPASHEAISKLRKYLNILKKQGNIQ